MSETFNWREAFATPEAIAAKSTMERQLNGWPPAPTDDEMGAALRWINSVGMPAIAAMNKEAIERGCTIWELDDAPRRGEAGVAG